MPPEEIYYKVDLKNIAPTEPHTRKTIYAPSFWMDLGLKEYEPAVCFNEVVNQLDWMNSIDNVFNFLSSSKIDFIRKTHLA